MSASNPNIDVLPSRTHNNPLYAGQMAAYLAGDRSVAVSPEFAAAVEALGKRSVDLESLTSHERIGLAGADLRWQVGPDGVRLWSGSSLNNFDPSNTPDCSWLYDEAKQRWLELRGIKPSSADGRNLIPDWIESWAAEWARWGYRFASIAYDQAFSKAKRSNGRRPIASGSGAALAFIPTFKVFLFDFIPVCDLLAATSRASVDEVVLKNQSLHWRLPTEILDSSLHKSVGAGLRDAFWLMCCDGQGTEKKMHVTKTSKVNTIGETRSRQLQEFLDYIAWNLNQAQSSQKSNRVLFDCPFLPRAASGRIMVRKEEGDTSRKNLPGQTARWKPEDYTTPVGRGADRLCTWISRDFPHLSAWELHAREFIGRSKKSIPVKLKAISLFVERYLNTAGVKNEPGEKLDPSVARRPIADSSGADALLLRVNRDKVPDTISALNESASKAELRAIRDEFIEDILNFHCSAEDEGGLVRLIEYYNPFIGSDLANAQGNTPTSTVRSAMPYRWIRLLRGILAQGPHFCDWKWAQQAQTSSVGNSADWFEVDESIIDKYDPDCVWRCRTTGGSHYRQERTIYEIWSPVRWLVLLTKLNTALRTVQVRVLDSGESDHWRFDLREWATLTYKANTLEGGVHGSSQGPVSTVSPWVENDIANRNPTLNRATIPQTELLRRGGRRTSQVWSNGALRRVFTNTEDGVRRFDTVVYANSNKTADARKEGAAKGFEIPLPLGSCPLPPDDAYWIRPGVQLDPAWPEVSSPRHREVWLEDLSENTHWWLAKLRDWQEKYNPIKRRIEWKELSRSGLVAEKADEQYEMYLPTCFLFREPSMNKSVKHPGPAFPLPDNVASQAWWSLNKELQDRLNTRRPEGQPPFKLVVSHQGETRVCIFDLHSIRVSLITALIVDGKVPVEIVQKMVGHSRLVMTIYYTVITPLHMEKQIYAGFKRAKEVEVETELAFLQNATAQEVRSRAAFNDEESAFAALGLSKQPVYRSVVMWARVLGGICPVGAATHDTEAGLKAGCFNGGSHISGSGIHAKYRPVEGGPGTCVNCRFLITMQPHIGELQAIYETAAYRKHEIHERALQQDSVVNQSKDAWDRAEANGANRLQLASLERAVDEAENLRERILADFAVEIVTAANAERLVVRLVSCLNTPGESNASKALVLNGGEQDAKLIMGQTSSAMLHAARISLHCELHPELRPSGAILRGSEILAKKLYSEGADPFALLALPEDVRHKALNAAMRDLSERLSPQDFETGLAMAVRLIESPHSLSDTLGLSRGKLSDWMAGCASDARDSASPTLQQSQPLRLS